MGDEIKRNQKGEIIELGHTPWPGYRQAFYLAFAIGWLFLLLAFSGFFSGGH